MGRYNSFMGYIGDDKFSSFLESIHFPIILPELKCFMLRHILSINMMPMGKIIQVSYNSYNFENSDKMQIYLGHFMQLWNLLTAYQKEGASYRFTRFPPARNAKDLHTRIYVRNLEVQALIPLLSEVLLPEHELAFQTITKPISPAIKDLKSISDLSITPFNAALISKWERDLDTIDKQLENAFNGLGWLLVKIRRQPVQEFQN